MAARRVYLALALLIAELHRPRDNSFTIGAMPQEFVQNIAVTETTDDDINHPTSCELRNSLFL